jgi:hypothetical protein
VLARGLYSMGVSQLANGEPMSAAAILLFHDAVELTPDAALEHLNILAKAPSFPRRWLVRISLPLGHDPLGGAGRSARPMAVVWRGAPWRGGIQGLRAVGRRQAAPGGRFGVASAGLAVQEVGGCAGQPYLVR